MRTSGVGLSLSTAEQKMLDLYHAVDFTNSHPQNKYVIRFIRFFILFVVEDANMSCIEKLWCGCAEGTERAKI